MAELSLNPLSGKQRKILQIGVVALLAVFLVIYILFPKQKPKEQAKNNGVYIENSTVYVFDDSYSLENYSDKVLPHYPYLVILEPSKNQSVIYNLETKAKLAEKRYVIDYDGTNFLYNDGKTTWFNEVNLSLLCDIGFIKSKDEVLCVTRINSNDSNNKLISINPETKAKKDLYVPKKLITAVSVVNGELYVGSINQFDNKSSLRIADTDVEFPDVTSFIYQMNGKVYVASMKSVLNNNIESSYIVSTEKFQYSTNNKIIIYDVSINK